MSHAQERINAILKEGKAQQKSYPLIFEELKSVGVTEYTVSWKKGYEGVYVGTFGTVHEKTPDGFTSITIAPESDLDAAKQALRENQQKKINFVQWLVKMGAAGMSHYRVDMINRTVTYYNPSETQHFTEQVPQPK